MVNVSIGGYRGKRTKSKVRNRPSWEAGAVRALGGCCLLLLGEITQIITGMDTFCVPGMCLAHVLGTVAEEGGLLVSAC